MSANVVPSLLHPHTTANRHLALSHQGRAELIRREGVVRHYYNDAVNNCTYGAGALAHLGPCTPQEMATRVTNEMLANSLSHGIHLAETAVRRQVSHQHLTQRQFDALVSFTYNVGANGARHVLSLVNQGQLTAAAQTMNRYTHATVYGPNGQPLRDNNGHIVTRVLHGLVIRRRQESEPFRTHPAHHHPAQRPPVNQPIIRPRTLP